MKAAALTIAGSDPSGGAGIQADLKTFHQFGVYGMAVVTLVTVQNTREITAVRCLEPDLVVRQIEAVISDIPPRAAKTGALGNAAIAEAVAAAARGFSFPLVVDPVMISKHGAPLLEPSAVRALQRLLLPRAILVTPNLPEAAALSGAGDPREAALRIRDTGVRNVLIKGGHAAGPAIDYLLTQDDAWIEYPGARIDTRHTHGTGCTYSAAIVAELARGLALSEAIANAKAFITAAIATSPGLGGGNGPVNHHAPVEGGGARGESRRTPIEKGPPSL
jgi:hydroxymethylpyrimidine/phosphomethylpyrimidine kinase